MGALEREIKLRLASAADLEAVARAAGGARRAPALQINHALDTADLALHRARFGLRVRDEQGHHTLTAKAPEKRSGDDTVAVRIEVELKLDAATAAALRAGERSAFDLLETVGEEGRSLAAALRAAAGQRPVSVVGSFENERERVAFPIAPDLELCLELDRTRFPGRPEEYELELEIPDPAHEPAARAAVEQLLARAGVTGGPSTSKAKRFFEALRAR